MRKLIIIGSLLALAAWLVLMPVLVGLYLRDAVPGWLAEWSPDAPAEFQPGWFRSKLDLEPETGLDVALRARHFPPLKPGWLTVAGSLDSPLTPAGANVQGHLGLTGSWHLSARAETFRWREQGGVAAQALSLNLAQVAGQPLSLVVNAEQLDLPGQSPPLLDLRVRGLRREAGDDRIRLGLDVQLRDPALGRAALILQAGPVEPDHIEELIQGVAQLAESSPGSLAESLAMVTLASAWQQMAAGGLVLELERLELGDQTRFDGRWVAAEPGPVFSGSGEIAALGGWLQRLIVVGPGNRPEARIDPVELLSGLGEVTVTDGRFRFNSTATLGPPPAQPHPAPAPAP